LPAAAKLVGHYVGGEEADSNVGVLDLADLARVSTVVVMARVTGKFPARLRTINIITTDYQLEVTDWFQGPFVNGQDLKVQMLGGRVRFSDGTTAEWREVRNPFLKLNTEYLFFLERFLDEDVYVPSVGTQSIFGFTAEGKVVSWARAQDEVFKKYSGLSRESFLAQVRASVIP